MPTTTAKLHNRASPEASCPVVFGMFLFSSVQLFFLGIIREYIGSILTQVHRHPLVVEKERLNF